MDYRNITVAGSGVLGSQIAFQTAYKGFHVNLYDVSEKALGNARERLISLKENYKEDLGATQQAVDNALNRISFYTDLAEAAADADLVIEAVPEVARIKTGFYQELGTVAPKKTIFATNSSTLLPSQFAEATGRPNKFLALHFANSIWKNNTAEVMKHPGTDPAVFEDVIEFARAIGMVALPLYKGTAWLYTEFFTGPVPGCCANAVTERSSGRGDHRQNMDDCDGRSRRAFRHSRCRGHSHRVQHYSCQSRRQPGV